MMRILIVCDSFPPNFAPRMGCLARYLAAWGWSVQILTTNIWGEFEGCEVPDLNVPVVRIDSTGRMGLEIGQIRRLVRRVVWSNGEFQPLADAMRLEGERLLEKTKFDVILASSSYAPFVLTVAAGLSKQSGVPWIADLRDLFEQYPLPDGHWSLKESYTRWWNRLQCMRRNKSLKHARSCVCVSQKHLEIISGINKASHLIINGYDPRLFFPCPEVKHQRFEMAFGGKVYRDTRFQDPRILFQAIMALDQQNKITVETFVFRAWVEAACGKHLRGFAEQYGVSQYLIIEERVGAVEYARRISNSAICVVFSSQKTTGVMTTKFFEYIGAGRPVLVVESDQGSLEETVIESGCGCAARSLQDAVEFLGDKISEWHRTGWVKPTANMDFVQRASREYQARQFEKLLLGLGVE